MKKKEDALKLNQNLTTLVDFMESYNKTLPLGYPHASVETLKRFQSLYPVFFKNGDSWSIDKHRKKLMDWLPSSGKIS